MVAKNFDRARKFPAPCGRGQGRGEVVTGNREI